MRSRRAAPALLAAWLCAPGAASAPPELRLDGTLESDTAYRLRSPYRFQKSQNRLELDTELRFSPDLRLRAIGRTIWDPIGRLVGDDPDFGQEPLDRWQVGGSRYLEAELRELYVDWRARPGGARVDLRVGKQQIVWGQSLGLRILDVVNAQDFREFILDEFNDARTPVFAAKAEAFLGGFTLEGILLPDFEPDVLPAPSSEFALDPELPGFLPSFAPSVGPPLTPEPFPLIELGRERTPHDWRPSSLGYGLRAARSFRGFDAGLYLLDAYDPAPAFERRVERVALPGLGEVPVNRLRARHVRVHTLGASFSKPIESVTLWAEAALRLGRAFPVDDLSDADGLVRRNEIQYVLGLDWTGLDPLFANLQWIQYLTLGRTRTLDAEPHRSFVTLLLRLPLRHETLFPQLFVLYGLEERDTLIRPSIEWRVTDRVSLAAGVDVFTGRREGLFGQYAHHRECPTVPGGLPQAGSCLLDAPPGAPSRVFLRVRYSFGLRR